MAKNKFSAKRIPNGTYGAVWLDAERLAECYGCQGKVQVSSDTINLCGQFMDDTKATNGTGSGSLTLYKVDSGFAQKQSGIQDGVDRRFTIISKLKDPDSYGAERVAVYNVSFDDLTLADWQAATMGTVTAPFTFSRYEYLDEIEVQ